MSSPKQYLRRLLGGEKSATELKDLPEVPLTADRSMAAFLGAVKDWVGRAAGGEGGLAKLVSWDDLNRAGVVRTDANGVVISAIESYLPPPAPTSLQAAGAMTNIILEWVGQKYAGHAYTEIWANDDDNLGTALLIGTSPGALYAHPIGAGQSRYYWVRFVSVVDVKGPYNAVAGVLGQTSNDPAWLLQVLSGQINEDQLLADLNTRIDLIDTTALSTGLPGGLLSLSEYQRGQIYQLDSDVDAAATGLLDTAIHVQDMEDRLTDAGVTVNPDTGQVYIYGLENYKTEANARLSSAEIRLDGAEASINLKASYNYVDQAIVDAVLDPSQVADLTDVYVRLSTAEIDIDAVEGQILLKASSVALNGVDGRLVLAEGEIDVLQGQITTKAETAVVDTVSARVTTAEQTLATIDGGSITQNVSDVRFLRSNQELQGEALLQNVIFTHREALEPTGGVAIAKTELTAKVNDGLAAEAAARLLLVSQINGNTAAIQSEQTTRANADTAISSTVTTLQSSVGANTAAIQTAATSIDGITAQYTVKIDNNGYMSGYGLSSNLIAGGTAISKFFVQADQFAVIAPGRTAGTLASVPLAVLTTPQTINGVAFQPGVYIDGASINSGTVGNAQIGNAAIDDAKIANLSAVKITAGFISADRVQTGSLDAKLATIDAAVIKTGVLDVARIQDGTITNAKIGNEIQSSNFASGTAGWRIDKLGNSEFNGGSLTIRGANTTGRLELVGNRLFVYDENGAVRVKIGDLS